MATPDWTTVPDTSLEPGDPIRSIDIIAINNHSAAMAGGATGAPEIKLMAIETLTSGTTVRSRIDTEVSTTTTELTVHSFSFAQSGTVNVYAEQKGTSGRTCTLYFKRTRNGTETTIATYSTASTSYVARNVDIDVQPGDEIKVTVLGVLEGLNFYEGYAKNCRFRTNGENLWPGVSVPLENDYTVV